jgi:hypothetical protein
VITIEGGMDKKPCSVKIFLVNVAAFGDQNFNKFKVLTRNSPNQRRSPGAASCADVCTTFMQKGAQVFISLASRAVQGRDIIEI